MHEEELNNLTPGERELEGALGRLAPRPAEEGRAMAIAFEAGRRAGRWSVTGWRVSTGAMAAMLAASLVLRPHVESVTVTRYVAAPAAAVPAAYPGVAERKAEDGSPYLALREAVLTRGLDALPDGSAGGTRGDDDAPAPRAMEVRPYPLRVPGLFGDRS